MDQGRQAGGQDDAAELSTVPVQRGAPVAGCNRLQPGELVAAAGATQEDRRLVVDQLVAAVSEDGGPSGEARPLLLAAAGRELPHVSSLRGFVTPDRVAAAASGIGKAQTEGISATEGAGTEKCPRPRLENRQPQASGTLREGGRVLPVLTGALNIENPTGRCTRRRLIV